MPQPLSDEQYYSDANFYAGVTTDKSRPVALLNLINQGCEAFYREIFGDRFWDSLDSAETNDKHHSEAILWHWEARLALLKGERPPNDEFAYFPIWSRGNMKTMIAEAMVCVDALLSLAYDQPGFCLYIGREKDKVKENVQNIEALFGSTQVRKYAPTLSQVAKDTETNQQGRWTASLIQTQSKYAVKGATVESAQAGSKMKETRVTFFLPDDIDSRDESPVMAETKYKKLTSEILPMKQANTLTFFAQNLINRYSTMYRIYKGSSKALANRKRTYPIPAVRNLVTEPRTMPDGKIKDIAVSGQCTWRVWNLQRVQDEIDTFTLPVFLTECQHEVDQSKEGLILYNYDDNVHVISESEFNHKFGKDAWKTWRKKPGNDWARTKTDKHANVAGWLMKSPQSSAFPNATFMKPYSFPADSAPEDIAERLLSELSTYAYKETTWSELRKDLLRRANADLHTKGVSEKMAFERGELGRVIPKYSKPLLQRCNVQSGEMSHEADTVRKIYSGIYGIGMRGVNPGKHGGTENFIAELRVDYDLDHPFRPDTKGYTQWFMIAPDDKSRPYQVGDKTVYYPKPYPDAMMTNDLVDSALCRFHFCNARYRDAVLTATGEVIDDPLKMHDDYLNLCQMWYCGHPLKGDSLTFEQKVDLVLPKGVKEAVIAPDASGMDKLEAQLNYEFQRSIAESVLRPDWEDEDDYGY